MNGLLTPSQSWDQATQSAQRTNQHGIGLLSGLMQLQQMQEASQWNQQMKPLQLQQLQTAVDQAKQVNEIKRGLLSGMAGPQPGGQDALAAEGAAGGMPGPTNAAAARIPQQGALSGGSVPPQVRLGLLSGDPGLIADAKAWIETNKPIAAREGAPVINPNTGQILFYAPKLDAGVNPTFSGGRVTGTEVIPGYAQAVGAIKGAETAGSEGAKAGFDLVTVPDGKGGTVQMSRRDALAALAPKPAAPMPGPIPGAPRLTDIPFIPPAQQQRVAGNMDAGLKPDGSGPAIPSSAVLGRTPTAAETSAATATAHGRADSGVKFEDTVLQGGRQGRSNLTTLQLIAPDLEKLPTGPAYSTIVNAKAYLSQFGLSHDPNLGPAQATRALLNQLALKVRSPAGGEGMPGAMSDPDREFLVASINGLDKLPDGNRRLMDIFMTLEQRKIDEASIVNSMRRANMGSEDIRNALDQYANDRPIRKMLKYGR